MIIKSKVSLSLVQTQIKVKRKVEMIQKEKKRNWLRLSLKVRSVSKS